MENITDWIQDSNNSFSNEEKLIDISPMFDFPMKEAAKRLQMANSTLSKRWKEVARTRKWPYRKVSKISRDIENIEQNIEHAGEKASEMQQNLNKLKADLDEERKPVFIKASDFQK